MADRLRNEEIWIQKLGENLTDTQRERIDSVAHEEVFQACLQDRSYMKSVVNSFLEGRDLLERCHEIAGGDRILTGETLGFDPVTGADVDTV